MRHMFIRIAASLSLAALLAPVAVSAATGFVDTKPNATTFFNFSNLDNTGNVDPTGIFNIPTVSKTDPRAIITNIVSLVSGFLGIIAVVIILISGFQWMTAGGDEEAVKTAQKRLVQGIIGLVLILSTWSVAYYVVNTLSGTIFK